MSVFGRQIKRQRTRAKLSRAEVGRRCGLSAPYIGMIENGRRIPSLTVAQRIAEVFGGNANLVFKSVKDHG